MAKANYMLCDACGRKTVYIGADEHPLYPIFCNEECVIAFASRLSVAAPPVVVPVDAAPLDKMIAEASMLRGRLHAAELDLTALRSRLTAVEQERDRVLRFAGRAIKDVRGEWIGCDWDGGDVQDALVACGLLASRTVAERCGEDCECSVGDTCYFPSALGLAAIAAARSSSDQEGR